MTDEGKDFAKRVRIARARLGITQAELAALVGVKRQTIATWEGVVNAPQKASQEAFETAVARALAGAPANAPEGHVDTVYERGAMELRQWLKAYTGKVLHAQADAFMSQPYADDGPENAVNLSAPAVPRRSARG